MITALNRPLLWLVAFNLIPAVGLRPAWCSVLAGALLAYRMYLDHTGRSAPPRWLTLIAQLGAGACVWWHYHSVLGDEAAGTLLTLLMVLKTFELRTSRDQFVVFLLALLTLMSYLLLDQCLLLTIFAALDVLLLTSFLFALGQGRLEWRGLTKSLGPSARAALKATPMVVIIFILFPRFSTGFGGSDNSTGKMGVTDSLRPGSVSSLVGSNELVFRATFLNGMVPPRATLYWRGAVLDQSDGLNWGRTKTAVRRPAPSASGPAAIEIFLEPGFDRFLYTLDEARELVFASENSQRGVFRRDGLIYELAQALPTRERYTLLARDLADDGDPANYLAVQRPPSAEMLAFLKQHHQADPRATVRALLRVFRTDYVYTLTPPAARGLDHFMFTTKSGFCEHYAAALASMLRFEKIPARVVVGFQGGSPSYLENYLTVRGHDAHAWVEYYVGGDGGWVRVDPTAQVSPQRINDGAEAYLGANRGAGWLSGDWAKRFYRSRAVFDEVDAAWTGFLLRFDLARQKELLAKVGMEGTLFRALPVFLILSIVLITAVLYFFESRRRPRLAPVDLLYYRLLKILGRRYGALKMPSETAAAYLGRLAALDPEGIAEARAVTNAVVELRYAPGPAPADALGRAAAAVRRLKSKDQAPRR